MRAHSDASCRPACQPLHTRCSPPRRRAWCALASGSVIALGALAIGARSLQRQSPQPTAPASARMIDEPGLPWRLNNPRPAFVPDIRAERVAASEWLAADGLAPSRHSPEEITAHRQAMRARSIEARALLRAYEGAPPVIPHSIDGMNIQTCRACHAEGLVAGGMVARMASHAHLPSCTQCHVEARGFFLEDEPDPENSFVGWRSGGRGGSRVWNGAPPVIPHSTFMRTNCTSCHGEHGYEGWRPDHLSRSSCIQCHAPSAELDQLGPAFGIPDEPDGLTPFAPFLGSMSSSS